VVLMNYRDADLNWHDDRLPPKLDNHDMDAPPWWHFKRKDFIYIDGFASKGHRGLMQFAMVRSNKPEQFREWEDAFRDVYAYIESVQAPKYRFPIDAKLAAEGSAIFNRSCAECHGTYGKDGEYPARMVPIDEVATDRVRFDALNPQRRKAYGDSWFNEYGQKPNIDSPKGYVAPPLDGIWASAPYFHNGSVPTLWHVLNSSERPKVWRRSEDGYDQKLVGLEVETFDKLPAKISAAERRTYFDTSILGKSTAGHTFPDKLSREEKLALLEYLKTL
jgi:mono/diheme cytochrome c family protein